MELRFGLLCALHIRFASTELRGDREIAFNAVIQSPFALRFASKDLQSDSLMDRAAHKGEHEPVS